MWSLKGRPLISRWMQQVSLKPKSSISDWIIVDKTKPNKEEVGEVLDWDTFSRQLMIQTNV